MRPPRTAACQASLSFTISQNLLKLMSIESMLPFYHLIFCHPLLLLPSMFSSIRVFSDESALCIRWPKYWSFSFSVHPSNGYSVLISFRFDWFDLKTKNTNLKRHMHPSIHQFSSVTQSCPTFCNPMDCSTPGFPVHHHLPELAQNHVHRVSDAIQPFHPLSSPSPPPFSLSQHQSLSQ